MTANPRQQAQFVRLVHRQRIEHDFLRHGENGGIGADAERQRSHRNGRKSWAFAQKTRRKSQIGPELVPPTQAKRSAHAFLVRHSSSQRHARSPRGLFRFISFARELGYQHLEMGIQLRLHFEFQSLAPSHGAYPSPSSRNQSMKKRTPTHAIHPCLPVPVPCFYVALKIVPMIPAIRFHLPVSSSRRSRPAPVRV